MTLFSQECDLLLMILLQIFISLFIDNVDKVSLAHLQKDLKKYHESCTCVYLDTYVSVPSLFHITFTVILSGLFFLYTYFDAIVENGPKKFKTVSKLSTKTYQYCQSKNSIFQHLSYILRSSHTRFKSNHLTLFATLRQPQQTQKLILYNVKLYKLFWFLEQHTE